MLSGGGDHDFSGMNSVKGTDGLHDLIIDPPFAGLDPSQQRVGNRQTGRGRHLLSNMADGQLFLFPDPSKLLPDFFDDLGTSEIFISHILSVKKYETSL